MIYDTLIIATTTDITKTTTPAMRQILQLLRTSFTYMFIYAVARRYYKYMRTSTIISELKAKLATTSERLTAGGAAT